MVGKQNHKVFNLIVMIIILMTLTLMIPMIIYRHILMILMIIGIQVTIMTTGILVGIQDLIGTGIQVVTGIVIGNEEIKHVICR